MLIISRLRNFNQGTMRMYEISTDKDRMDLEVIHTFLTHSYWAKGIPKATVQASIENSFCFGLFKDAEQVGLARVITDYATFAYLADVFVLESERGKGLGKMLIQHIMEHPRLQGLRNWTLATRDAHGLYVQFGFQAADASLAMMKKNFSSYEDLP